MLKKNSKSVNRRDALALRRENTFIQMKRNQIKKKHESVVGSDQFNNTLQNMDPRLSVIMMRAQNKVDNLLDEKRNQIREEDEEDSFNDIVEELIDPEEEK